MTRILIAAAVAAAAVLATGPAVQAHPAQEARAQEARAQEGATLPLTWQNIFTQSTGARQAALSPDGARVAVAASTPDRSGIFLVDIDGGAPTFLVEGSSPVWMPDGSAVLYTMQRDLWIVPVVARTPAETGTTREADSAQGSRVAGGPRAPHAAPRRVTNDDFDERAARPSPDGRTIAFYSGRGGAQDVWTVGADGSTPARQLTHDSMAEDDFRFAPAWSPDGSTLAYFSNRADYWEDDIWVVDVASGVERQISQGLMASSSPVWSPDGSRIALLGTSKDEYWYEDLAYLYVLDPVGGTEAVVPMQVYATDWLHNLDVFWSADGAELYFPYMERARMELWRVPAEGGVATRMTSMGGHFRSYHANRDASGFVFIRSTPTRGSDVDYLDPRGGSVRRLTRFSTRWEGVHAPEEISYRSWDGLYIQGFLYRPPDFDPEGAYPTLVQVHGGGTNAYLDALNTTEQYLAQQGYVVLAVNYRGGSGFGRPFQDLGVQDWANGQARDAAAAADFVRAQPWSSGKVGIYGYSYGGITSMAAIARVPDAFDAAVPMAGIYDFADAYTNADRLGKIFTKTGHGGSPAERPDIYAISNTLSYVEDIETPVLTMHGEADVRAPYRQFELVVDILERNGKVFEAHSYPGEPHGFRNPMNRVDMYQRLEAWFDLWLRGEGG
jgi:dipeptidyl aminopeptidase/acylaminoacyl peptidase